MTVYFNPLPNIDLSQLPTPSVIEEIAFEDILSRKKAQFLNALPESLRDDVQATLALESEPITILLQQASYDEMILRQRINDACKSTMLAFAMGTDLDHIGATFGVSRLLITPADDTASPPIPAVFEGDDDYRRRIQLSREGYSCAGSYSAYLFYALSADSAVKDISITRPVPGEVAVYVLSRNGNGQSDELLINKVRDVLSAEDVRPLNDTVTVKSSVIIEYEIRATLTFYPGVHQDISMIEAQSYLTKYVEKSHRNGVDITVAGIIHALKQEGVQNVVVQEPASDIIVNPEKAAFCTSINLTNGGINV